MTTKFPWYLRVGATLHVMDRWRPDDALELVARHRMPTIGVVAPQLALMLRSPLMESLDLSCVQGIIAGGAASPPSLVDEARRRFGAEYSIRYSSTESGGVGLGTAFGAPDSEALHTVGRPRPGVEVRIADDRDVAGRDRRGRRAAAAVRRRDGRLLGRSGRHRRSAHRRTAGCAPGTWHASTTPAASCCAVVAPRCTSAAGTTCSPARSRPCSPTTRGSSTSPWHPAPTTSWARSASRSSSPGTPPIRPRLEQLRAHGADRLAHHKLPEHLVLVPTIPLTGAQKIDRRAARDLAG